MTMCYQKITYCYSKYWKQPDTFSCEFICSLCMILATVQYCSNNCVGFEVFTSVTMKNAVFL
jgi:hypothetical protein